MLMLSVLLPTSDPRAPQGTLTLPYELRRRARLRARLDGGIEVGLLLGRGLALKAGDRLTTSDGGLVVEIRAKFELLSVVESDDPHLLTRAAYHLGNRHVALQVEPGRLAYQSDHVLDGLMRELGLLVQQRELPFEPETGGYSGGHGHAEELDDDEAEQAAVLGATGGGVSYRLIEHGHEHHDHAHHPGTHQHRHGHRHGGG